jgi:hypothetical protein
MSRWILESKIFGNNKFGTQMANYREYTKKILILSANPQDTQRLRLEREIREIEEGLKLSKYRKSFIINQQWAVRFRDIRRALLEYEPQIIHFCGHGKDEGIIVEGEDGNAVLAPPNAIAELFALFEEQIECVLLNACYSSKQADAIIQHINYVIGMDSAITDKAAIEFALGFYDALGAGKPIEVAFKFGCNAINLHKLPGNYVPVLKKKPTLHSKNLSKTSNITHLLTPDLNSLHQQYDLLSSQLHQLKMDRIIERDTLMRFRLEKQIERIEEEILEVKRQIGDEIKF